MIGLDTNVLVRYLVQDDPTQSRHAARLIESMTVASPGFISQVVLVETVWVLESCYDADAGKIVEILETLLRIGSLVVERADVVWRALHQFRQDGGDFSDALIMATASDAGCTAVHTFDKIAVKRSGMTLLG